MGLFPIFLFPSVYALSRLEEHNGRPVLFRMEVTGAYGGDPLKRQITESVNIQNLPAHQLLNRRDEWRQTILPRLSVC